MAVNVRKIRAFRDVVENATDASIVERARRRRTSITDYRPLPT